MSYVVIGLELFFLLGGTYILLKIREQAFNTPYKVWKYFYILKYIAVFLSLVAIQMGVFILGSRFID